MHTICCSFFPACSTTGSDLDNNSPIFYHFVGNFVPPEWRDLSSNSGKVLSKTARCLVPGCNVVYYKELPSREELWEKYYTAVPKRQRQYVSQSKIVKRA
ncbi:hypothetical protein [Candidatus Tisiphia endosymbiont of Oplodontha viridula]|uniref:hypothetical protein n=1 Tax=Candidatus Tisiphia endosymbiont of Oplodontha viridula TaxID=3077925 RepID=UPI0035C8D092